MFFHNKCLIFYKKWWKLICTPNNIYINILYHLKVFCFKNFTYLLDINWLDERWSEFPTSSSLLLLPTPALKQFVPFLKKKKKTINIKIWKNYKKFIFKYYNFLISLYLRDSPATDSPSMRCLIVEVDLSRISLSNIAYDNFFRNY